MRKLTLMLLAAATATGLACTNSDSNSVTGTNVVAVDGLYALQSVEGKALPMLLYTQDSTAVTVLNGQLEINTAGGWTETVSLQVVTGSNTTTQTASATGTLFRSGTSVVFTDMDNNLYYTGTVSAKRLDLDAGGVAIVYAK